MGKIRQLIKEYFEWVAEDAEYAWETPLKLLPLLAFISAVIILLISLSHFF